MSHLVPQHPAPPSATNTMSTPTLHHMPPLDYAHRLGRTKIPINTAINITMAHTPRLAPLRSDDPHPGLSYTAVNTINTLLSPPHLLPVLHLGLLYPIGSFQFCKIAGTLNVESRQSPGVLWTRFPFNFIYLSTIAHNNNPDPCTLLYPYIIIPPLQLSFSYTLHSHSFHLSLFPA